MKKYIVSLTLTKIENGQMTSKMVMDEHSAISSYEALGKAMQHRLDSGWMVSLYAVKDTGIPGRIHEDDI